MSILKFQVNVPARVALSFPTGKPVEGQFGPQVMFGLCLAPAGEKTMYVPPVVAEQIQQLGIVKGQPFQILKAEVPNGSRPKVEWKVSKLEPEPVKKPVATAPVNGHASANGIPYRDQKTEMVYAYHLAVDVLVEAAGYAASKNLRVQFLGEDIRQLAAVILIDKGKDRHTPGLRAA